jgi:hypothetical protein
MKKWPWLSKKDRSSDRDNNDTPSLVSNLTSISISSSPPQPEPPVSKKAFPSGIKSLHIGQDIVAECVYPSTAQSSYFADLVQSSFVFIHGLTGDREETWKTKGASSPWPATLLPTKISNTRVLTFGYDAYVADWRGMVSKNRIGNHSMNLLSAIATHRGDDGTVCLPNVND